MPCNATCITGFNAIKALSVRNHEPEKASRPFDCDRDGIIPPTINLDNPDKNCDLDYVSNIAKKTDVNTAMTNSFGFGGTNAVLIISKYSG